MKVRTLIISILAILVVSNVSLAQVAEALEPVSSFETPTEPKPEKLYRGRPIQDATSTARTSTSSPKVVKIYQLKYADAENVASLISSIFRMNVSIDYRLNRVIVNATPEQIESVENLIEATDVADPEASISRDVQNLIYRIYMFEIPSSDQSNKSFSMILQTPAVLPSTDFLQIAINQKIQVSDFLIIDERDSENDILIRGKAPSDESIKQMTQAIVPSKIKELKWDDDETFTNNIAAAQYTQLPEQMQEHISKFLGDNIRTVGYWFGNLSLPGEVKAPIGPWILNIQLDRESDHMLELDVNVKVPDEMNSFNRRLGRDRNEEILSNTIRAKIGKPIIIGYNRESYGTRKMGAMVIIPEADMLQLEGN